MTKEEEGILKQIKKAEKECAFLKEQLSLCDDPCEAEEIGTELSMGYDYLMHLYDKLQSLV